MSQNSFRVSGFASQSLEELYIQKKEKWMLVNHPIHFIYKLIGHNIISKLHKNTSQMTTNTRLQNNMSMNISPAAMIRSAPSISQ